MATTWHELALAGPGARIPPLFTSLAQRYRTLFATYGTSEARHVHVARGHLSYVRDEEREFVTPELVRATTLTGTAEELRARVSELEALGFDQLSIQLVPGHEQAVEDWARVFGTAA